VLVTFLVTVTKILDKSKLKEEGFILAHGARGFSLVVEGRAGQSRVAHIMAAKKQRKCSTGRHQGQINSSRTHFQ
jgi:hypothetical protein